MVYLVLPLALVLCQEKTSPFADVVIEKPFDAFLLAHPLLMDGDGARIVRRKDGTIMVIGIASTAVRDGSPADRKRAEVVCKTRALASIVSEKQGVVVAHEEKSEKKQEVVIDANGKQKTKAVHEYLDVTRSKLEGLVPGFEVIGRWKSPDRKIYFYAVGGILDPRSQSAGKGNRD
jgi:hypothetical protein